MKKTGLAFGEAIDKEGRSCIHFKDLPLDVLYTTASKLPSKEFARTSALSSKRRYMWPICPRLTFDGVAMCKCLRADLPEHTRRFCFNLEWLCIDRCSLNDELTVNAPLSHLLYLHVDRCKFTKIEFNALQNANIQLDRAVFQHALISLLNGLPNVRNLTLRIAWLFIEKHWLWDNPLKFSCLRHLQLFMFIYARNVENILYSVSFMRATPFTEELEVHFTGYLLWLADVGPRRQDFGQWGKTTARITFTCRGKCSCLEVLTVDTNERACEECWPYEGREPPFKDAKRIALTCLKNNCPINCQV
ncbi:hypothetical protein SETIT_6G121300v2 [Setaria italica]|uniref:F-box domain-containing protein n=1 Tax=Setaria italica TaxID=4555 RepID=A0A368RKT8_SETIT|nr:hypothetical protein SETIT_6G121300v2 [Setaria italica]